MFKVSSNKIYTVFFTFTILCGYTLLLGKTDNDAQNIKIEMLDFSSISGKLSQIQEVEPSSPAINIEIKNKIGSIPFSQIRNITFNETENIAIVSDKSAKCQKISSTDNKDELIHGWNFNQNYSIEDWQSVQLPRIYFTWAYIPQACWLWYKKNWNNSEDETILIRQNFNIPNNKKIISGVLKIAGEKEIIGLFINGESINCDSIEAKKPSIWDVSYLLRNGNNFIAVKARNKEDVKKPMNPAGISYRIDVKTFADKNSKIKDNVPGVIVFIVNGDVIKGKLKRINEKYITVVTDYTTLNIDRDWIRKLVMNYGSVNNDQAMKGILQTKAPSKMQREVKWQMPDSSETKEGILLNSNDLLEGKVLSINKEKLFFKPNYGGEIAYPISSVNSIFFNTIENPMYYNFPPEFQPFTIKIRFLNNDLISALINNIADNSLIISAPYAYTTSVKTNSIINTEFLYSLSGDLSKETFDYTNKKGITPKVAIIGEFDQKTLPLENNILFKTTQAVESMGFDWKVLSANELTNKALFNKKNYPILINLDEHQQFYRTLKNENDAMIAIIDYANKESGTVISLGVGNPFYFGLTAEKSIWEKKVVGNLLSAQLGMNVKTIGERSENCIPFEKPFNNNNKYSFIKNSYVEYTKYLPNNVEFPQSENTSFYPISRPNDAKYSFYPIYYLHDDCNTNYGVAMAVIIYKGENGENAYTVYASHLLSNTKFEGRSMVDYILPVIMNICLTEK